MALTNRTLFTADNLEVMRGMNSDSVDLIYLDPPFNSNATYSAPIGSEAAGAAFKDTWTLDDVDAEWHGRIADEHPALYKVIDAAGASHSKGMQAYLIMMAIRLIEMRRILRSAGSIYLHCDPTASHYLKALMDCVFGRTNFRNEIVWGYAGPANVRKHFTRKHDIILFYGMPDSRFNADAVRVPHRRNKPSGGTTSLAAGNRTADEIHARERELIAKGKLCPDHWSDIGAGSHMPKNERTGYPTQKPLALLERIIQASSNPGDFVFDPFCGCATTLVAAEKLSRKWGGGWIYLIWQSSSSSSASSASWVDCCSMSTTAPTYRSALTSASCRPRDVTPIGCTASRKACAPDVRRTFRSV